MEKLAEIAWLLDFYGPLLTKRQQTLLRLYCEEDLTLAEIAAQEGISRQAVHDAVRKGDGQLCAYEAQLGLLKRYRRLLEGLGACQAAMANLREIEQYPPLLAVRDTVSRLLAEEEGSDGV